MSKRRLYFHIILLFAAVVIGGLSLLESGLVSEGKDHPNLTALAMVLLVVGQIASLKAYQSQKRTDS